jgi:hypothetical protein
LGLVVRDIKLRYWWEFKGYTLTSTFTIDQIEHGVVNDFVCSDDFPAYPLTSGNEQFTGLQDYEDVEMYEGDVVQVEGLGKCVVSICPYNGVTFHDLNDQIIPVADCLTEQYQFRVIGNIHENPDLYK